MNLCVNGQSQVPPGFRFHPTEEELLQYYLRKQVAQGKIDLDVIPYVDLNKLEPWDIQEKCKIGSAPQNEWYFFNQKDKKYPTGSRTNRATETGFWKATGRDKVIHNNVGRIGMRKTLVFYIGRAPCGQKSDWIMYEYRLGDDSSNANARSSEEPKVEEGWVVCRLFRKKNFFKPQPNPKTSSSSTDVWTLIQNSSNDGDLEQILRRIVRPNCKQESETSTITNFTDESNKNMIDAQSSINNAFANTPFNDLECGMGFTGTESYSQGSFTDQPKDELDQWLGLDQLLVASKFGGEILKPPGRPCFYDHCGEVYSSDIDEWSFVSFD